MLPFDPSIIKSATNLQVDDYGNIYVYKSQDFSFIKYDSLANRTAQLMSTIPFKIQSVQNPLMIPAFSENAQELRFYDQNLNEIQRINFRQKFGYVKDAYVEDLQQIWLLDESSKNVIQYQFREDRILNSVPILAETDNLLDFMVFDKRIFLLYDNRLAQYDFKGVKTKELPVDNPRKLRRENDKVLIMCDSHVEQIDENNLVNIFKVRQSEIVDKNSLSFFVIIDNKLYLYPFKK